MIIIESQNSRAIVKTDAIYVRDNCIKDAKYDLVLAMYSSNEKAKKVFRMIVDFMSGCLDENNTSLYVKGNILKLPKDNEI